MPNGGVKRCGIDRCYRTRAPLSSSDGAVIVNSVTQFLKRIMSDGSKTPAVAPAALLMPLEPRIVYDASVAAVGASAHHHPNPAEQAGDHNGVSGNVSR